MKQTNDIHTRPNIVTTNHLTTRKFKVLTANVKDLNNLNNLNLLKTKKIDLALLQETHSTKITEIQWENTKYKILLTMIQAD